jgi:hypothetical protein
MLRKKLIGVVAALMFGMATAGYAQDLVQNTVTTTSDAERYDYIIADE